MRHRLLLGSLLLLAMADAALAATCTKGQRRWVDGAPAVREYSCPVDPQDSGKSLRVSFLRLNEAITGNLVLGEATPELEAFFGKYTLARNEVFRDVEDVFRKFASKTVFRAEDLEFAMNVKAELADDPAEWRSMSLPKAAVPGAKYRRVWTLSTEFERSNARFAVFPRKDLEAIRRTTGWPAGSRMTYKCLEDAIMCTKVWRTLKLGDLKTIAAETESEVKARVRRGELSPEESSRPKPEPGEELASWPDEARQFRRHFALFEHLGTRGWLDEFLLMSASALECEMTFEFGYHARPVALDVAVIENASPTAVEVKELIGTRSAATGLRAASTATPDARAAAPLGQGSFTIGPGTRIIVPLRMLFLPATEDFLNADREAGSRMYERIMRARAGTTFESGRRGERYRKKRESFLKPELPEQTPVLWGPELAISGLAVAPAETAIDGKGWNLVSLSSAHGNLEEIQRRRAESRQDPEPLSEPEQELRISQPRDVEVSCPFLYSWADDEKSWVSHGKIIEAANAPEKEMTSLVNVDTSARRFRISEEEPEVASIGDVALNLTLADGRTVVLLPSPGRSSPAPGRRLTIEPYTYADITFEVPDEIERVGIVRSSLAVTGYYQRLGSLKAAEGPAAGRRRF